MASMDQIIAGAATGSGSMQDKATTAVLNAGQKAALNAAQQDAVSHATSSPYLDSTISSILGSNSGLTNTGSEAQQQQNTKAMAQQRKQHLMELYNRKKCD